MRPNLVAALPYREYCLISFSQRSPVVVLGGAARREWRSYRKVHYFAEVSAHDRTSFHKPEPEFVRTLAWCYTARVSRLRKWSRGDSNPRAGTVCVVRLRV